MSSIDDRIALLPRLLSEECPGPVRLIDGWRTHGRGTSTPVAIMNHWTATISASLWKPMPTLYVVRNGWGSLPGPLYNVLVGQDGAVAVVSVRLCNHAGLGNWAALQAAAAANRRLPWTHRPAGDDATINRHAWAVSADHSGSGPLPARQLAGLIGVNVALCRLEGWSANRIYHHASSTRRKADVRGWPDFVPLVDERLRSGRSGGAPTPDSEDEMKRGERSESVRQLQHWLNRYIMLTTERGHAALDGGGKAWTTDDGRQAAHLVVDGHYGASTEWFVHHFKRRVHPQPGDWTWYRAPDDVVTAGEVAILLDGIELEMTR